jgi:hypothetical protein
LEVDAFFMILICGMYYKCENDESWRVELFCGEFLINYELYHLKLLFIELLCCVEIIICWRIWIKLD